MTMTPALAIAFVVLLAALAVFQLMLAAGLPFGRFAWGGQHKVLPRRLRVGSALSVLAYGIFAFIAVERADITNVVLARLVAVVAMWVIAGYLILSVLANLASKSASEKRMMVPVSLALATLATLIAVG
jgi:Kef-type K+ transport system membrane component KefB